MRPPTYRPPYDSPIEDLFAQAIVKRLHPDADFIPQYEVETIAGRFRLDFVALHAGRRVGFECDGAYFHHNKPDEWRDAAILGDNLLDSIFRLRGADIHNHVDTCLHLIALREPVIFSERGRQNLQ